MLLKASNLLFGLGGACFLFFCLLFGGVGVPSWGVVLHSLSFWVMGASFLAGTALRLGHYMGALGIWASRRRG